MRPYLTATALGLVAVFATRAEAQADTVCHRCLNGFRFIPSSVVDEPFATTFFQNSTGGGSAVNLSIPVRNLAGDTIKTIDGRVGFLLVDFEYRGRVSHRAGRALLHRTSRSPDRLRRFLFEDRGCERWVRPRRHPVPARDANRLLTA